MGILKEMFEEGSGDDFEKKPPVLLAKGRYKSDTETILSGYKIFRKRYVFKGLIFKLLLVILALASSVMMLMTSDGSSSMPVIMILLCIFIGIYFISQPVINQKNLKKGLDNLDGSEYEVEITDRTVKISTVLSPEDDSLEASEEEKIEENDGEEAAENKENEDIPATIIHLDSSIVDFIDHEGMFIICVKKSYVFIIPKSAFTEEEVQAVKEKLSMLMGIRFKIAD